MNASLALHTEARRYCLDRHAYWCDKYSEIVRRGERQRDDYHYTEEALNTFPRYNVLNAIRVEIERIDPDRLGEVDKTRELLVLAGHAADDEFTTRPQGEIDEQAIAEERLAFCRHINGLNIASPNPNFVPLPFRRVLTSEESKAISSRIRSRWAITGDCWMPLAPYGPSDVFTFNEESFHAVVSSERLQRALQNRGIERIWELREFGPEYEMSVFWFEPFYNGAEGYWCSANEDWIVSASHEGSVTVGGWLLEAVKEIWPSWHANEWATSY